MVNDLNTYLLNHARMNWLVAFIRKIYPFSLPITSILVGDSCNFLWGTAVRKYQKDLSTRKKSYGLGYIVTGP